ncbi:MAG TPA: hypothetical protein VN203_23715, partial [Candidatus Acidoferrum sp.]|nr:hypothetical protein [Candidatus Acidoferrum sp.]
AAGLDQVSLVDLMGPPPSVVRAKGDSSKGTLPASARQQDLQILPQDSLPTRLIGWPTHA